MIIQIGVPNEPIATGYRSSFYAWQHYFNEPL
jgi:hypothetical protein